jgi:hypothetical protein
MTRPKAIETTIGGRHWITIAESDACLSGAIRCILVGRYARPDGPYDA